jgi:hypothetical protein
LKGSIDKNDEQLIVEAANHATAYHSRVTASSHTTTTSPHHREVEVTEAEVPSSGRADHDQFGFWNLSISRRVKV